MSVNSGAVSSTLKQRYTAQLHRVFVVIFASAWVALVTWGYSIKDEDYISASSGLGYYLGMTGGSMILLLLTYSLRKRFKPMRGWAHIKWWFRIHMILGVLGPTCILFHSRFSFGSPNSTVALVCLITVASSGVIGRFLYNRIHAGVHGEKIKLVQVRKDFLTLKENLMSLAVTEKQQVRAQQIFDALEDLIKEQKNATMRALIKSQKRADVISKSLNSLIKSIELYHEEHPEAHEELSKTREEIHACSDVMFAILKKLPGLHLFERLFSLWHVVHLPIMGLMLVTAVTHVIVVHMY